MKPCSLPNKQQHVNTPLQVWAFTRTSLGLQGARLATAINVDQRLLLELDALLHRADQTICKKVYKASPRQADELLCRPAISVVQYAAAIETLLR